MSDESFIVIVALIGGALAVALTVATFSHWRRFRRATLRTRGWQLAVEPYDDESTYTHAHMFWFVNGRRHEGRVKLDVSELEASGGEHPLAVNPGKPDTAYMASDRPAPITFVVSLLYAAASLTYLALMAVGLAGVKTAETEMARTVSGSIVAGGLALLLLIGIVMGVGVALWMILKQIVLALPRAARGEWRSALGGLLGAVALVVILLVGILAATNG